MSTGVRAVIAAGLAGTALSAVTAVAVPADAATPNYTCDRTYAGHKGKGWGWRNCVAANGAPARGEIHGTFLVRSRKNSDPKFECKDLSPDRYPSGNADLPREVLGFYCG